MPLQPMEMEILRGLYSRADKTQKGKFVEWMTGQAPVGKPASLSSVEEHLAGKAGDPICPRCGGSHLVKNGKHRGHQRFLCKDCMKSIGYSHSSIYFSIKKPYVTWETFERCMAARMSLRESARRCNISVPTAFAWRKKYLKEMVKMLKKRIHDMEDRGLLDDDVDWENIEQCLEEELQQVVRGEGGRKKRRWLWPCT